ncbi:MAG: hypothetical protein ACFFD4_19750, partial [Candidatus Odinarchaeota archaeon]
ELDEGFLAYSKPYETEGVLFQLDILEVCKWLYKNEFIEAVPATKEEAKDKILALDEETAEGPLMTLLHTLSHVLIRRSSVYTGLDSDSCSELIFPRSASFFIYSTSNINTGGFQYIFENEIRNWFNDIDSDIRFCTFDPSCLAETGACFACCYLPEYVCNHFNKRLNRDTLLGREHFSGFWTSANY